MIKTEEAWGKRVPKEENVVDENQGSYMDESYASERKKAVYVAAMEMVEKAITPESYARAAQMFESVGAYEDAENMARFCREKVEIFRGQYEAEMIRKDEIYAAAMHCMNMVNVPSYERAAELFQSIPGWRDADEKSGYCRQVVDGLKTKRSPEPRKLDWRKFFVGMLLVVFSTAMSSLAVHINSSKPIPFISYHSAVKMYEAGDYEEAYLELCRLNEFSPYEDSEELARRILAEHPTVARVGDIITFGKYEQDGNAWNGQEDIEWIVYWKGASGIFVTSKYVLDCQPYDTHEAEADWEECSLNTWLNDTFLNAAFDEKECAVLLEKDDGTASKVSLLSQYDVRTYLQPDMGMICEATPYARDNGVEADGGTNRCRWWIEDDDGKCRYVLFDISDDVDGTTEGVGVRPVIKITE